uniref:Uncharacterized protein n=1 Tax=Magallana gigas TaxID=29159 RepID=K1QCD6_MAGGI
MNMMKRRGSSMAKPESKNLEELKSNFLGKIEELVTKYKIPPQLIINYDHTGVQLLHVLPVSRWTMAEKGCDKVNIVGLDDKREITGVMAGALSGDVLPPQDQVAKLPTMKCVSAAYIGSSAEIDARILNGEIDIIYASRERDINDVGWRDEFHTIATW